MSNLTISPAVKAAELRLRAADLERQAKQNTNYAAAMVQTSERTAGRLGHLNNPSSYNAHISAAAIKRTQADVYRAEADTLENI